MYAIVMMMGLTTPQALPADRATQALEQMAPQGILFGGRRRGGCSGSQALEAAPTSMQVVQQTQMVQTTPMPMAAPPQVFASGCNGAQAMALQSAGDVSVFGARERPRLLAAVNDARPRLLARIFGGRRNGTGCNGAVAVNGAGCNGSVQTFHTVQTFRVVQPPVQTFQFVPVQRATGCNGSAAFQAIQPNGGAPQPGMNAALGDRKVFLRLELHHAINVQERQGQISQADAAKARQALEHPKTRNELLAKVDAHYNAHPPTRMSANGDHPLLDWFVQNWGTILQMIKDIISMFGYITPSSGMPQWQPRGMDPAAGYALAA
jgi:hypothetical protein